MKHMRTAFIVSLASVLVAGAVVGTTQERAAGPAAVVSQYSGTAKVKAAGAAARSLRVEIKEWHFVKTSEAAAQLPAKGFYIAQLTSGRIDTEIAGKREHRRAGDFWTVAAGQSMSISFPPHSESAQIQTIAIAPGAGKE